MLARGPVRPDIAGMIPTLPAAAPRRAVLALAAVLAACSGPSEPPSVSVVAMSATAATLLVGPSGGQSLTLTATPQQSNGRPITGRLIDWRSSNPTAVLVSASGIVTALAPGTATVTATVDAVVGSVAITVLPVPVASVTLTPAVLELPAGFTQPVSAVLRDSAGAVLTNRPVVWTSSAQAVASVTGTGVVQGVSAGTATITATAGGRSATVAVTVTPPPGPVIVSVSPPVLVPGQPVTLTGDGFAAGVGNNVVRVAGRVVTPSAVSASTLTFVVPCVSSGPVPITVTSPTGTGPVFEVAVSVPQRTMAVGESLILTDAATSLCNELTATGAGARYLIAVSNVSTALNTLVDFELAGNTPLAAADPAVVPMPRGPTWRAAATALDPFEAAHTAHMAREAQRFQALRAEGAFDERPSTRRLAQVAPPAVGTERTFYFNFNSCSDSSQTFTARAIYSGAVAIIWEDTANVIRSTADAQLAGFYTRLGQVYDSDQHGVVRDAFGDPLRRDALTDNDGRIHMVFTQRLNGTGAAAYVTSCDMAARNTTSRAASNGGELFYGRVPTQSGSNVNNTAFPDGWFAFMGRTVVHEVKHIASLSARIANNAPFEAGWLEEGTARHAEELWARVALHRVPWKGNTGYGTAASNGLFCDFNLTNATCLGNDALRRPSWGMRRQLNEIRPKLAEPWAWSPYGDGTGQSGAIFYNTAWSLVRYAIDRFGTSEEAFLGALTQSTSTGMTNLATVAGVPQERLIGGWGLALVADDYPGLGTANADIQFATWNLRAIYAGLHADPAWTSTFPTAFPILPAQVSFGAFVGPRAGLRAGAHAYYELSGAGTRPQLLELRGLGATAASPLLRIALVRVN
jgi:hypothetical protein